MRFIFSVVSLSLLMTVMGCAPKGPTCNPTECSGCCDSNDKCQPGDTVDACGSGGFACNVCVPAAGQVCANLVCAVAPSVPVDAGTEVPDAGQDAGPMLGAEIGTGDHTSLSVVLSEIAGPASGLRRPTDLAFNPLRPDELWAVNSGDDSVVIVFNAGTAARSTERRKDGYAVHFMAKPSSIAFGTASTTIGKPGTFATCQESRNTYGGAAAANDFMGASLWSSDLTVFAKLNPNGLGSHLDMMHDSPLCMGLAHEDANIFWAFGGLSNSIVKYNFAADNGVGNDDHSDGEAYQYITGQLKYAAGIPSHLAFQQSDRSLFISDTGNSRILKMDTTSGTRGQALQSFEPMAAHFKMENAVFSEVVTKASLFVQNPSGLEIKNGLLYVSDNANSRISVFTMSGERVNYLDTGLAAGSLSGLAFGPDNKLYLVDMVGNRVLRVDPR